MQGILRVLAAAASPRSRDQRGVPYHHIITATVEYLALVNSSGFAAWSHEFVQAVAAAGDLTFLSSALQYCQGDFTIYSTSTRTRLHHLQHHHAGAASS